MAYTPDELRRLRTNKRITVRKLASVINARLNTQPDTGGVFPSQLAMMERGTMIAPRDIQTLWEEICTSKMAV